MSRPLRNRKAANLPAPYENHSACIPTPTTCPNCGSLVILYFRTDTGKPIALECIKHDYQYDFANQPKKPRTPKPQQDNLV